MTKNLILTMNAGSSSLKFGLFKGEEGGENEIFKVLYGQVANLKSEAPKFSLLKEGGEKIKEYNFTNSSNEDVYEFSTKLIMKELREYDKNFEIIATAHRVVHGGDEFKNTVKIDKNILEKMQRYAPLAALHQPFNIKIAGIFYQQFPSIKHFACFDTAFHQTIDPVKRAYAIALKYFQQGVKRYGFHGLSYQYIAGILEKYVGQEKAKNKWIVAHLGSGSSLCAIHNRESIATTMGFSVLDGIPMATRSGELDPAIITYIQEHDKMDLESMNKMLYHQSGLLGLSGGISSDIKTLIDSKDPNAQFAIEVFAYLVSINIGKLVASAQGCDGIIFTAGIGENSYIMREKICSRLAWLGVKIDKQKNIENQKFINSKASIPVLVLPTSEEYFMASEAAKLI